MLVTTDDQQVGSQQMTRRRLQRHQGAYKNTDGFQEKKKNHEHRKRKKFKMKPQTHTLPQTQPQGLTQQNTFQEEHDRKTGSVVGPIHSMSSLHVQLTPAQ